MNNDGFPVMTNIITVFRGRDQLNDIRCAWDYHKWIPHYKTAFFRIDRCTRCHGVQVEYLLGSEQHVDWDLLREEIQNMDKAGEPLKAIAIQVAIFSILFFALLGIFIASVPGA